MRDAGDQTALPSVRDVLALPELQAGQPELVAGSQGVDRDVRWAHVAAGSGVAELLDGGELILTTGAGWPSDPRELADLAEGLVTAGATGVAAIVLELGQRFTAAPEALIHACEENGVPLIVLHREVRFVQITQRVHQRILAAQNEALQARAEVHAMLTELGLNRSPVDYVVERLAETLGAPVLLEDTGHRVVAFAGLGADPAEALAPWVRADGREPQPPKGETWERVAVEARGRRWGHVTALAGPPHPAGRRTVLELGAFALALGRLADAEGDQWMQLGSKRLFEALLGGRYRSDAELAAQLAASGLTLDGRTVIAATLRGTGDFGGHATLERATLETALRRAIAPEGRALIAPDNEAAESGHVLLALLSFPTEDPRLISTVDRDVPSLATRLAHELGMLVPGTTPSSWRAHLALATPARRLRQLVAALEQVRAAGRIAPTGEVGRVTVQQAERQPLAHLVRALAGAPELQEFATDTLAPLLAHDRAAGAPGDLLRVLAAYTAHPTNRSLAAKEARLSRSVFYQRLALIEDLLDVDLSSGETIATLTVARLALDTPTHSP
ncbi:PucR family transcriptional regulator [Leucobacter sp. Z1108]|uniref:PucR family transcriptional regulator n=1 Tax=Leucobacter sp. Z1108 TaxID=3439066 RepID=UPI003F37E2FD